jgi:hypothetical protein
VRVWIVVLPERLAVIRGDLNDLHFSGKIGRRRGLFPRPKAGFNEVGDLSRAEPPFPIESGPLPD